MKNLYLMILLILMFCACQKEQPQDLTEPKLYFYIGDVKIDNQDAQVGKGLQNNSLITTGKKSMAEVKMNGSTAFQVREDGIAKVSNESGSWEINASQGAILNLVQRGTIYHHRGPTAAIAVRGTIFYVNCYNDSTQYVCTCNGSVQISDGVNTKEVSASHHEPYLVKKTRNGIVFEPAEMKEHDDLEIFEFMYRMGQERYK